MRHLSQRFNGIASRKARTLSRRNEPNNAVDGVNKWDESGPEGAEEKKKTQEEQVT